MIDQLLTDPQFGLLPYLEAQLGQKYERLQIRPYSFNNSSDQQSGFRLRGGSGQEISPGQMVQTQQVQLGRQVKGNAANPQDMIAAANLQADLDKTITEWSRCRSHLGDTKLTQDIVEFDGAIAPIQNKRTSDFWIVVVRSFEISYYA